MAGSGCLDGGCQTPHASAGVLVVRRASWVAAGAARRAHPARQILIRGPKLCDPEPVEQALIPAPVAPDAHGQVQMDMAVELPLDLLARGRADRLDHAPAGADHDPLLGLALHPY